MNKRQKIIVSIVGITIVLLALLGITYAYYLTRIEGNTNTNSISVTTAKLELVYSDNSEEIISSNTALMPKAGTDAIDAIGTKTFTVTNNGNDSSYVVIIDKVSIKIAGTDTDTNFESNDFRYTLSCIVKDKSGNVLEGETCNKVTNLDIFPIKGGILVSNNIKENKVHEYTLTLWYIDTGIDQSDDMGKSYQARVNIKDMTSVNPFSTGVSATDTTSLVYNIINNAKTNKNGTQFVNVPLTTPAEQISSVTSYKTIGEEAIFSNDMSYISSYSTKTWYYYDTYEVDTTTGEFTLSGKQSCTYSSCYSNLVGKYLYNTSASNNSNANYHTTTTKTNLSKIYKVVEATSSSLKYVGVFSSPNEAERVLAPTTDDYGTSYYYRGDVEDNYVNFAGMCWRIVRIEGDGSTKLILEDMYTECNNPSFTGNWSDGKTYRFGYENSTGRLNFLNFLNYEGGLADSFKTFQTTLAKKMDSNIGETPTNEQINNTLTTKLKVDEWCYDDKVTETKSWGYNDDGHYDETLSDYTDEYYGAYTRIKTNKKPSLNCSGTKLTKYKDGTNMYVGTLTADEMSFAGAYDSTNYNYYLMNSCSKGKLHWWSLSPISFAERYGEGKSFSLYNHGVLFSDYVSASDYSRPAVSLKSGSVITEGDGTLEKPYVIG